MLFFCFGLSGKAARCNFKAAKQAIWESVL